MRVVVLALIIALVPNVIGQTSIKDSSSKDSLLVFEATVLRIGRRVPASGRAAWYRLAKYRINRICRGEYQGTEIIVDHLSLTASELDGVKVGDRVCVVVNKSDTIAAEHYAKAIREYGEGVRIVYFGGQVISMKTSACECE